MDVNVKRGDSLWSVAKRQLPAGATNQQIQAASTAIATANGLAPDAQLKVGQTLVVPDHFTAGSSGAAQPQPAVPAGQRVNAAAVRAKPFVAPTPTFSPVRFAPKGSLALPDIAGVPVRGQVLTMTSVKSSSVHASALESVDARFGTLTRAQFDAVHAALGGRSRVVFDAARDYAVADFLPPAAQALLHQDLEIADPVTLKGTKHLSPDFGYDRYDLSLDVTMNCHATAWETMRAYQGDTAAVSIFYGEMVVMDGLTVTDSPTASFDALAQVAGKDFGAVDTTALKPGDLVQFFLDTGFASASTNLLHSAVYVGGGLFFEKPNTEGPEVAKSEYQTQDETPYRLGTAAHLKQALDEATGSQFRAEVKRPKAPLPPAATAFASSLQADAEAWAKKKGRTLGATLVPMYEQGMGGNIRSESTNALVELKVATKADGTGVLG
jgi:hypothetical protein